MPLRLLPSRHAPVPRGRRAAGTLLHARGPSRPRRPLHPWLFSRRMQCVLPRPGRGTPRAYAVERPLSRPRGARPLLSELLLSLQGRRVAMLRRQRMAAHRRLAGIVRQALLFQEE